MLTSRQLQILQVIIDDFIHTGQPVGSRTLSKKDSISFSSATIRNEMADLEELGFIEKTHSSSGRVPSQKGYRFYVDHLLAPSRLSDEELQHVQSLFRQQIYEKEIVMQKCSQILTDLTNYTSIVLGPNVQETRLQKIQIVPLNEFSVVAIIITDQGNVQNKTITLAEPIDMGDLEKTVNILNEKLVGVPISKLQGKIFVEIAALLSRHIRNVDAMFHVIQNAIIFSKSQQVFAIGKSKILSQPEFHDISKIKPILKFIENESLLTNLFEATPSGIQVLIGSENKQQEIQDCSLISAHFVAGEQDLGTIAILGPTRMDYAKVVSLLNVVNAHMARLSSPSEENNK